MSKLTVFDITVQEKGKPKDNVFTAEKPKADHFVLTAMFKPQVSIKYKKYELDEKTFEVELGKRMKEFVRNKVRSI